MLPSSTEPQLNIIQKLKYFCISKMKNTTNLHVKLKSLLAQTELAKGAASHQNMTHAGQIKKANEWKSKDEYNFTGTLRWITDQQHFKTKLPGRGLIIYGSRTSVLSKKENSGAAAS